MANVLFWCFGGAILGWLTSLVIGAKRRLGTLRDVSVGASGAVLTGWLMPNLLGAGLIQLSDFNAPALGAALLGALLCLAGVGLLRRIDWHTIRRSLHDQEQT